MKFDEFLHHCTACGGNWTAMIMTGIKAVAPDVYASMPERTYEFDEVCFIANHLCEDRPHYRFNLSFGQVIEYGADGTFHYRAATDEERNMSQKEFFCKYNGVTEEEYYAETT